MTEAWHAVRRDGADLQRMGTEIDAGLHSELPAVASCHAPEIAGAAHAIAASASSGHLQNFAVAAGLAAAAACFAAASAWHDVHSEADACAATQAGAWTLSQFCLTEGFEVAGPADYSKVDTAAAIAAADAAAAAAVLDDDAEGCLNSA